MQHYHAVIMAGGGGTRLWPLSRQDRPKQSLKLLGERTMFQVAVERLGPLFAPDHIWVVSGARYADDFKRQCPEVPAENYVIEPAPRGTAPAVGLAALRLQQRDPDAVMACLTADHYIGNEARFRDLLGAAAELARQDYLVTLGIRPNFAATGFGYIQRGASLGQFGGFEAFQAVRFKEKPDQPEAEALLADGLHSWNSGMFVWRVSRFMAEVECQLPQLQSVLSEVAQAPERLVQAWDGAPETTLDYGIMEGARSVAVIPADGLAWNDIGSWEALLEVLPADADGNVVVGAEHLGLDTTGTLVHAQPVEGGTRLVATIGVSDLVVVAAGDVLLVCPRARSQDVRELVKRLKQSDHGREYV